MKLIFGRPPAGDALESVFFGGDLVENDVGIGDAREGDLEGAEAQRVVGGLVARVNSTEQAPPHGRVWSGSMRRRQLGYCYGLYLRGATRLGTM